MFRQRPNGIVVISGPDGVGKSTLMRKLIDHRRLAVRIDYAGKSTALTEEGCVVVLAALGGGR
jgi:guanylate kinase